MCGIFGWISQREIPEESVQQALRSLSHRGPDNQGIYWDSDRKLALGHRRLSIIDLSPAGRQPMTNEDGTLWITYNGEIYNHPELREELIAKGHRFQSRSDTETILHLYEEEGEDLTRRLTGMFAFAIYDKPRKRLLLARDRLGIKPLFYARRAGSFLFASEIKGILAAGVVPADVDWQAIRDYFTYLFVPHPSTAFAGIRQMPPATQMVYHLESGECALRQYWTPWQSGANGPPPLREEELKKRLRETLTDAVHGEMLSDVPLGLFFSGGIDSTLLAALMTRHSNGAVKTFTVGFRGIPSEIQDDLPYARLASKLLGTEHHELIVELRAMEDLLSLVECFDQPFANPTFYLQYLIARETRAFVTVALSGVGGDELFGGYPKYQLFPWAGFLRAVPSSIGEGSRRFLGRFREDTFGPLIRRTKRLLKGTGVSLEEQYLGWSYYFTEAEKRQLLKERTFPPSMGPTRRLLEETLGGLPEGLSATDRFFYAELQTFLAGNLLEYTDRTTMAVALETRVPFLDHRLVELSARIPFQQKVRPGKAKMILLETFRDILPPAIARAPKRGFAPPMARWMTGVLDRYFDLVLTEAVVRKEGIFEWEAIRRLREEHRKKLRDASMHLLSIILFDVWFRRYILNRPIPMEVAR